MDGYILKKLMEDRRMKEPDMIERFKDFMRFEQGGRSSGSSSGSGSSGGSYERMRRRREMEDFFDGFDPEENFYSRWRGRSGGGSSRRREGFGEDQDFQEMFENMGDSEKRELWETLMGFQENGRSRHFNHSNAKYIVSELCHTEGGNKHVGEKFSIEKAEEIYKRYKSILPEDVTMADVYVAINCHYHDFAQLYKAWFGDSIDTKIIESAIVFWFKDEKFPEGDKLYKYFRKMK